MKFFIQKIHNDSLLFNFSPEKMIILYFVNVHLYSFYIQYDQQMLKELNLQWTSNSNAKCEILLFESGK